MVGYNYDGGGSKRMTTDEREATRALGGIALIGGLTYLWLTSKPSVLPARDLTLFAGGAYQERGTGFVLQPLNVRSADKQELVGFNPNSEINIFAIHNGEDSLTATIKATFNDGSTKSVSKSETMRTTSMRDNKNTEQQYGEGVVQSSFDIEPNTDFDKEINQDGKSITEYSVTLNVSGKGKTKTIAFIVGA